MVSSCIVFPTHVGMDRECLCGLSLAASVPHARGDGPVPPASFFCCRRCSPRTWGWTVVSVRYPRRCGVFPTHVGMDRPARRAVDPQRRVPHARGDGPRAVEFRGILAMCSPRTWGWTAPAHRRGNYGAVFPTHVGMDFAGAALCGRPSRASARVGWGVLGGLVQGESFFFFFDEFDDGLAVGRVLEGLA